MKNRVLLFALLFLVMLIVPAGASSSSQSSSAVSEKSVVLLPHLFQEHIQANRAHFLTAQKQETSVFKTIEDVLAECDNYYDLDFALAALKSAEKAAADEPYLFMSLYKALLEKARYAAASGRSGMSSLISRLESKLKKAALALKSAQMSLDLPEGTTLFLVSIEDNSKERRRTNFERILDNHNMKKRLFFDAGKISGHKNPVYHYVAAASNSTASKLVSYFKGQMLTKPFVLDMTLYSGGFFSPVESSLRVKAPQGLDADTSLDWLNNQVIARGWDYIYESQYEQFKKHASLDEGKDRIKNPKIRFSISVDTNEGKALLLDQEKEYNDLYYNVK